MHTLASTTVRAVITVLSLLISGCSGTSPEQDASGDPATGEERKNAKSTEQKKLRHSLKTLGEEIDAALEEQDWPVARRLIARGIGQATEGGNEFERERGQLLLQRGNLARDQGDEVAARRDYADSMAIFRVNKDEVGRFSVHLAQAQLEETLGAYAAAGRQLTDAEALLVNVESPALRGAFLVRSGRLANRQVRLDDAYKALLEASRIFADMKDRNAQAETLIQISVVEDAQGETRQCRKSLEKALSIFKEIGKKDGQVRALYKLAALAERDQQFARARSLLQKVQALYQDLDRLGEAMKVEQHINALPESNKKKKK